MKTEEAGPDFLIIFWYYIKAMWNSIQYIIVSIERIPGLEDMSDRSPITGGAWTSNDGGKRNRQFYRFPR